jgi:hypothetical protein
VAGCDHDGTLSGFGPLIVATFGFTMLDAILLQFLLEAIHFIFTPLTGFYCEQGTQRPNYLINILLPACYCWIFHDLEVNIGSSSTCFCWVFHHRLFWSVFSLVIPLGSANLAGATKKSFMAVATFGF